MRIARWTFLILLIAPLCATSARAQDQQDDSLAAAARRSQEAKKDQSKPAKVYDNDSLPTTGGVNVIGQDQSSADSASATGNAGSSAAGAKPAPSPKQLSAMDASVSASKELLKNLKADLDIAQRKYTLDQATFYGTTNFAADKAGAAALDGEKSDIDAKVAEVAAAEKALADAQAAFDAASKAAASQDAANKAAASQAASAPNQTAPGPAPAKPPQPQNPN
jgi:hypothetical protein